MPDQQRTRERPQNRFDGDVHVFDLRAEGQTLRTDGSTSVNGHAQKALWRHAGCTTAMFAFDAGGGLPEHKAAGVVTIMPVEGEIDVSAGDESHHLDTGVLLTLAPNVPHALKATDAATVLVQIVLGE